VINLEQTADSKTRRIAETFVMDMDGGHVAIRHRIVYAGLMAAVVESWHPHGNHSYGKLFYYGADSLLTMSHDQELYLKMT
jgi:hypothetical protein